MPNSRGDNISRNQLTDCWPRVVCCVEMLHATPEEYTIVLWFRYMLIDVNMRRV